MRIVVPRALASLCLGALVGACATVRVGSSHDPAAAFAGYRTFAVASAPATAEHLPGYSALLGEGLRARVAQQLTAKGLTPAGEGDADLIARIGISALPRSDVSSTGSLGPFGSGTVDTINYVECTLVIDLLDRRREALVWHGWASDDLFGSEVENGSLLRMADAVLALYPPSAPR